MSIYSVIDIFYFNYDIFCHFDRKWRIQSTKYCHFRDQQVNFGRNRHFTCLVSKVLFLAAILIFFRKRGRPYWWKLPNDFADFKKQTVEDKFLSSVKFWRQSKQNCDRESAAKEHKQNGRHDVTISKFQNPRKNDLANICQIICRTFHQNRSIRLGYSAATHTHRYTHI